MRMRKLFTLGALGLALVGCGSSDGPDNSPGSVALSGSPIAGELLTAIVSDADGFDASGVSYQWLANDIPLPDQTNSTFLLSVNQRGAVIRVSVTYVDNNGTREGATSNQTEPVLANEIGVITVSGPTTVGSTLIAEVTDGNGLPDSIEYSWSANGMIIDGETQSSLILPASSEGTTVTATATYTDLEGFTEEVTSLPTEAISPEGTNTPAEFSGLTATTTNQTTEPVTGMVTVTDVDDGENGVIAQTDTALSFGIFSITETGEWTYLLDTTNETVAALANASEFVEDSAVLESIDGTVATLVLTITGVNPPATSNQAAVIRDLTSDDTGELRYILPEALAAGRLEVQFTRTDDEVGSADAFITLFNVNNNNAGSILDLRVRDDSYQTRFPQTNLDSDLYPVVPGTLHTIVATWEYPNGNTSVGQLPTISLWVDGEMALDPFTPDGSDPEGGVTTVSFRIGSNSTVLPTEANITINEFSVFSDISGETLVFEDTFATYAVDDSLDPEINPASPYSTNTEDATVEAFGDDNNGTNQYAKIIDTDSGDTGELRYILPEAQAAGRLDVRFTRTDDDLGSTDAFISLFNVNNNNAGSILDLRVRDDSFQTRFPQMDLEGVAVTPGTFQTLSVTWEYPNGNTSTGQLPTLTLFIDGNQIGDAYTPDGSDPEGGVTTLSFRFGSNSTVLTSDAFYLIDDIIVYSDTAGTNIVYQDDFQSYADGEDLDPDNNPNSVYASNTSEAVVESDQ